MTVGGWRDDLQALPPKDYVFGTGGTIARDSGFPGGSYAESVKCDVKQTLFAALFGEDVNEGDLTGTPYEFARYTTPISYYKNNPYSNPVWTGSVTTPIPPSGDGSGARKTDAVYKPVNFGGSLVVSQSISSGIRSFPDYLRVDLTSSAVLINPAAIYAAASLSSGPSAGYPIPEVPQGYRLEWEYPDAEYVGMFGAADTGLASASAVLGFPVTWMVPDYDAFRPMFPGEYVSGTVPIGDRAPTDNAWGQNWALGSTTRGQDVSATVNAAGPWGTLPGTSDPLNLPTSMNVVALPGFYRGYNAPGSNYARGDQTLAVKVSNRARRYRFVGLSGVRQYPRDDGAGLSSPRISTSQRPTRIAGGYR